MIIRKLNLFTLILGSAILFLFVSPVVTAQEPAPSGKIAFIMEKSGDEELYVINADGSDLTNLSNHPATDTGFSWSPDGQKIAFNSDRDGTWEIYVVNVDGTDLTRLTNSNGSRFPVWSPDGQKIAYTHWVPVSEQPLADGNSAQITNHEVYIINSDGSNPRAVTDSPNVDYGPTWAFDSQRVVFNSDRNGIENGIYIKNIDGTNLNYLDEGIAPNWSPDGSKIAFVNEWNMYLINPDGSGKFQLTQEAEEGGNFAIWSPDGQQIAYHSSMKGCGSLFCRENIMLINPTEGSEPTFLTKNSRSNTRPTWSPDGNYISYVSNDNNKYEIYTIKKDGSSETSIYTTQGDEISFPIWSPGGVSSASSSSSEVTANPAPSEEESTEQPAQESDSTSAGETAEPSAEESAPSTEQESDSSDDSSDMSAVPQEMAPAEVPDSGGVLTPSNQGLLFAASLLIIFILMGAGISRVRSKI